MTEEKKSSPVNQSVTLSYKLPFYKWKIHELFLLGNRLDQCLVAIADYNNIASDYKIPKVLSLANVERLKQHICFSGSEESWNADEEIEFLNTAFQKPKKKIINELKFTTTEETLNYVHELLRKINIEDEDDLSFLCHLILIFIACGCDYEQMTEEEKEKFMILEHFISARTRETIGYWTGRMPFVIQMKENVKSRTDDKEERKAILKEWMNDKKMTPKERHIKAMQEWDITERTVLLYEQEIRRGNEEEKWIVINEEPIEEIEWRAEKTALLRKKDDIA